ncbi:acyl-CoA dehydrogenase family protein [Nocardioides pacificus]
MDFELDDEQAMLREVSRSMLTANCPAELVRAVTSAGHDVDDKLWQRGCELGWTGLLVPEEHDGAGQGLVELCLVTEELGRAVAPGPVAETALVARTLAAHAAALPDGVLDGLCDGSLRAAVAHSGAVMATVQGDDLVLDGRVRMVHSAGSTDWLLVVIAGDDARAVLVETATVATRRRATLDETRGWYDVTLEGVRVPLDRAVATGAEVQTLVDAATVLTAADLLGVGERLLEMTIAYVKVREQFGVAIGSFQAVKHKVADMAKALKGVRAATYYAAMSLDAGLPDASMAASVAKAYASEQVPSLAGEALQTHGGIGFTWEHDLHLYLRRAKVDEALYGDAAAHHERVVAQLP